MPYLTRAKCLLHDIKVEGCRIDEIVDLEKELNIFLPEAYKEFLLWMGKDTGEFLKGSEIKYSDVVKIQKWANELLEERDLPLLPNNAFVFFIHGGCQFCYFLLDGDDDPKVYLFDKVISQETEQLKESYSEWITTEAEIYCQYQRDENYEKD